MPLERTFQRGLMVSGYTKEATYGAGVGAMTSSNSFGLEDFPNSALPQWDDMVAANNELVSHTELATHQEIVRQSVRFAYQEDRLKVNTFAWLMGQVLGAPSATREGALINAYRHHFVPTSSTTLPSVVIQDKHDNGAQYSYHGILAESVVLTGNSAFWQIRADLVGDGSRLTATDAIVAPVPERWLLWGHAHMYIEVTNGTPDTPGTPITIPAVPVQGASNLTGSIDLSPRIHTWEFNWTNNQQTDLGYRPGTGLLRQKFYPSRRMGRVTFEFDVDSTTEATDLTMYLSQQQLAIEMNLDSGRIIDTVNSGVWHWGVDIIMPRVQLGRPTSGSRGEIDTLRFEGTIMDDRTNPAVVAYAWNGVPAYLV